MDPGRLFGRRKADLPLTRKVPAERDIQMISQNFNQLRGLDNLSGLGNVDVSTAIPAQDVPEIFLSIYVKTSYFFTICCRK